ncbi:MAG: hypothetical protein H6975_00160 [Gammaproteobacteria bacterium]|nr:hypothetical protein [Gammaproteobacteria bacterium]
MQSPTHSSVFARCESAMSHAGMSHLVTAWAVSITAWSEKPLPLLRIIGSAIRAIPQSLQDQQVRFTQIINVNVMPD